MQLKKPIALVAASSLAAFLLVGPASAASAQYGVNLIQNPGAESGKGSPDGKPVSPVPNWKATGSFTAIKYGASGGFPVKTDPRPPKAGANFFGGGENASLSTGEQVIDVAAESSAIKTGKVTFALSSWLGGWADQGDFASLTAKFLDKDKAVLSTTVLGPVKESDRKDVTGLFFRSASGTVPADTQSIDLVLTMTRTEGASNDGYADNLSLVLTNHNKAASIMHKS